MIVDPKSQKCLCGYSWKPGIFQKMIMLLTGSYTKTCPQCHGKMTLKMIYHVVIVERENVTKEDIWRNG